MEQNFLKMCGKLSPPHTFKIINVYVYQGRGLITKCYIFCGIHTSLSALVNLGKY